jgi:hypothetical protein
VSKETREPSCLVLNFSIQYITSCKLVMYCIVMYCILRLLDFPIIGSVGGDKGAELFRHSEGDTGSLAPCRREGDTGP